MKNYLAYWHKRFFCITLIIFMPCLVVAQNNDNNTSLKVLFVGNSYTYYHAMPQLMAEIYRLNTGKSIVVGTFVLGGAELNEHAQNPALFATLQGEKWDKVVLQDCSTCSFKEESMFEPTMALLIEAVKKAGATPVLYSTWARDPKGDDYKKSKRFKDYNAMQIFVSSAYQKIADEYHIPLVDIGRIWQRILEKNSELPMFEGDAPSHPTVQGSYLVALTFAQFFAEQPITKTPPLPENMTAAQAQFLVNELNK